MSAAMTAYPSAMTFAPQLAAKMTTVAPLTPAGQFAFHRPQTYLAWLSSGPGMSLRPWRRARSSRRRRRPVARAHELVRSGAMSLRAARIGIATNWQALSKRVFGRDS